MTSLTNIYFFPNNSFVVAVHDGILVGKQDAARTGRRRSVIVESLQVDIIVYFVEAKRQLISTRGAASSRAPSQWDCEVQCGASLYILHPALRYIRWILPSQKLSAGCYSITFLTITLYRRIKINFRLISTSHFSRDTLYKNPFRAQF